MSHTFALSKATILPKNVFSYKKCKFQQNQEGFGTKKTFYETTYGYELTFKISSFLHNSSKFYFPPPQNRPLKILQVLGLILKRLNFLKVDFY